MMRDNGSKICNMECTSSASMVCLMNDTRNIVTEGMNDTPDDESIPSG
jgi:hypothetical protein